jgi:HAD superfamily hydrolase (TIGR01509 family)
VSTSEVPAPAIRAVFFDFYGVLEDRGRPQPGVTELASRLRRHYLVGVISNASERLEGRLRNGWGAIDGFDAVITSGRTGHQKPSAPIFGHAAWTLGLQPPACVHVDDSPGHVEGARHAGFHAVLFTGDIAASEDDLREIGLRW